MSAMQSGERRGDCGSIEDVTIAVSHRFQKTDIFHEPPREKGLNVVGRICCRWA
jgi:hypothetical protein